MSFVVAGAPAKGKGVNFGATLCSSLHLSTENVFECMEHDTYCVFVFSLQLEFTPRIFWDVVLCTYV